MRNVITFVLRWVIMLGVLAVATPIIWRISIIVIYSPYIDEPEAVTPTRVAIVFGGGVRWDGQPSDVLRDRLDTAIDLYHAGKVERLLLTGDNSSENYNEPAVMLNYAQAEGIPLEHLQPDYGGRRTYDSCYRAKHIFELDTAILVTQRFHMSRALFLCRWIGIDAHGVTSDSQSYVRIRWFQIREIGATLQAAIDLARNDPAPIMGAPILIE